MFNDENVFFPADYEQNRRALEVQMNNLQQQMNGATQDAMVALNDQYNTLLQQYRMYYGDDPLGRDLNPL